MSKTAKCPICGTEVTASLADWSKLEFHLYDHHTRMDLAEHVAVETLLESGGMVRRVATRRSGT